MSIDGLFTASLAREISERITGGRIDRVSMPDRYRVMISIRHPGTACILAASIHPERPRLSLTYRGFDDPEPSPAFCSVLRRHLLGGGSEASASLVSSGCLQCKLNAGMNTAACPSRIS